MNILTLIILFFSLIGAWDRICNNRMGLGKEFDKGFLLFGNMALSMIGMIIISPYIADLLKPFLSVFSSIFHIDPSVIPALLFANDMGGASLASEVCESQNIGMYNALVVSSMMGCTISFTIPVALEMVDKKHHNELLLGLLCGITTIPLGCFVSGLVCKISVLPLICNLLPLVFFSIIIAVGLMKFPKACVKIFSVFGYIIKILITIGLALGIIRFLSQKEVIQVLETIEEGARICLNASIVMTGTFPLMYIVSKKLSKPLKSFSRILGVNESSSVGFISSLATSLTTFGMMDKMDKKGIMLNSAFAVSAAFTFAGHLAFTMAFNADYVVAVIIGKLVSGISAVGLSLIIANKMNLKGE